MQSKNTRNKYYVYCFYNEDWQDIFYIGKGCRDRYTNINQRNSHIKAIFKNHNCSSKILVDNLTEEDAINIESKLKEQYKTSGSPIIDYEGHISNQRKGIEQAKRDGKYKGRTPIKIDETQFRTICESWRAKEITAKQAMINLNLKPDTFYRRVKQLGI